jgi:hypothetical protein
MQEYAVHVSNRTVPSDRFDCARQDCSIVCSRTPIYLTAIVTVMSCSRLHVDAVKCLPCCECTQKYILSFRWLLEDQSRSTRENAVNSIGIIADQG